jgi:hypothetical protein
VAHAALTVIFINARVAGRASVVIGAGLIEVTIVPQTKIVSQFVHKGSGDLEARRSRVVIDHTAE